MSDGKPSMKHRHGYIRGSLNRVEPNIESQSQARYDLVETWLEQMVGQGRHPRPCSSPEHRRETIEHSYSPGPRNAATPCSRHPRNVDRRWSPRLAFPNSLRQSRSPPRGSGPEGLGKHTRGRSASSDSSFIGGFENSTKPPGYDPIFAQRGCGTFPLARPLSETGLDASSIGSHVDSPKSFERRPRRKTREDRYEVKKEKKRNHRQEGTKDYDDHRRKKRKRSEKKRITSSKNVVNNFASEAVLNDRITVQPYLKPGLFENGRASKKQPPFSEMQFLKHQKGNTQPKVLSKSRLKERQREDREMEQVSSFFLPRRTSGNIRKPKPHSPNTRHYFLSLQGRSEDFRSIHYQKSSGSSPLNHRASFNRNHVSRASRGETTETPILCPRGSINDKQGSGRNTTYLTWPSSRNSPQINGGDNGLASGGPDSVWTTTPEPIRKDLIATGIYRNTGIPLYDGHSTCRDPRGTATDAKITDSHRPESGSSNRVPHNEPNESLKVKYRDQAVMTDDPLKHLERCRKEKPSPEQISKCRTEFPPHNSHITEDFRVLEPGGGLNSRSPHIARGYGRMQIAKETRLTPVGGKDSEEHTIAPNEGSAEVIVRHQSRREGEKEANQNHDRPGQELDECDSETSRDAMPPPPIPHVRNNSIMVAHASVEEAGHPSENYPATGAVADVLQAPDTVDYGNSTQDSQGIDITHNTAASTESAGAIKRTLSSLDTASWIPQRTPSVQIMEKQAFTPQIHLDHPEDKPSEDSHERGVPSNPQASESMAEFIARIERESQLQCISYHRDISHSESSLERAALDYSGSAIGPLHEHLSICDAGEEILPRSVHNPYSPRPDLGGSGLDQHMCELYTEMNYPRGEVGSPMVGILQPLDDFENERFEMLKFWRPNQFSRF
ncbi:hypothetical protein AAE478_000735 [Parahypoxylon ruwenzoriense]